MYLGHMSYSAIHKAADPQGPLLAPLQLMGVSGIVPGKIMEQPGIVMPTDLWIALLKAGGRHPDRPSSLKGLRASRILKSLVAECSLLSDTLFV